MVQIKMLVFEAELDSMTMLMCNLEDYESKMKTAMPTSIMGSIPVQIYNTQLEVDALKKMNIESIPYEKIMKRIHTKRSARTLVIAMKGFADVPVWVIGLRFCKEDDFKRALGVVQKPLFDLEKFESSNQKNNELLAQAFLPSKVAAGEFLIPSQALLEPQTAEVGS